MGDGTTYSIHACLEGLVLDSLGLKILGSKSTNRDGNLADNSLITLLTTKLKSFAILHGSNNSLVVFKTSHSLEASNELEGNGLVVLSDRLPEELVKGKIGVGEVELDLNHAANV